MHRTAALGLHALAHDIATGTKIPTVRWYSPPDGSRLFPVPVLPEAIHDALCPSMACLLQDDEHNVIICAECHLAIEHEEQR